MEREPITEVVWGPRQSLGQGSGAKPPEAESFLTVERPQEAANFPRLLYFAKSVDYRSPLADLHVHPFRTFYMHPGVSVANAYAA